MNDILVAIGSGIGCVLAADFISGFVHWAEDTWLPLGRSEVLDRWVVRDNVEHHRQPGKIREGTYWETNRASIALAIAGIAVLSICHAHAWQAYLIFLLSSHANQVHKWAHSSRVPLPVGWLQRVGILQSSKHHAKHHKNPYATRFCAVTNFLNPILDTIGFWLGLESLITLVGIPVRRATPSRAGF